MVLTRFCPPGKDTPIHKLQSVRICKVEYNSGKRRHNNEKNTLYEFTIINVKFTTCKLFLTKA